MNKHFMLLATCWLLLQSGCGTRKAAVNHTAMGGAVALPDVVQLADDTFPVLAKPIALSRNRQGHLAAADESDRDVKIYDVNGHRIATVGKAGHGAGNFTHLNNAQFVGDSVLGYDFTAGALMYFPVATRHAATTILLTSPPHSVQVVDDSLLLFVRHPGQSGPKLAIATMNGDIRTNFFDIELFKDAPRLRFMSALYADAHDGNVFVAVFGGDSIYQFNYHGKLLATYPMPATASVPRLEDVLARNGNQDRRADSSWFHDGIAAVMGLVALYPIS